MDLTKDNIKFATPADVDDWMELVSLTIDGYPCLDKDDYTANLYQYIADKKALILRDVGLAIGVMGFSSDTDRAGDKADTGWREEYRRFGFTERELLVEYGYPTQCFVLLPENKEETPFGDTSMPFGNKEETRNDRNTEKPISEKL